MNNKVYDKVKWHYPEGDACENLETAKIHFEAILGWFDQHDLFTEYGKEIYDLGVDSGTSITSDMFTEAGIKVLEKCYDLILNNLEYGKKPSLGCFEDCLKYISDSKKDSEDASQTLSRIKKFLEATRSPKEMSEADAEWLIENIESSGQMGDDMKALLKSLKENVKIPGKLSFKLKFWGI